MISSTWRRAAAGFALGLAAPLLAPCVAGAERKLIGIDYAGGEAADLQALRREDLLGTLKMSGTWVSKLKLERYVREATLFCRYASARGQSIYLQIPVSFTDAQVVAALGRLAANGCSPSGFVIGNEVDRLVAEKIAARYSVREYIADYNRIVPLVARHFPSASIVALELSSFMIVDWRDDQPAAVRYRPIFDWLVPFCKARLVRRPDFVSVHFYPFTGAQKEWETLAAARLLERILDELAPQLADAPPLMIGEFNATYQYEHSTIYPGSGGESFMIALAVPGILAQPRVASLFHWSLAERPPSVLGLYQGEPPAATPLFHAYRLSAGIEDASARALPTHRPGIEAYAAEPGGKRSVVIVNTSPFFRRDVKVSGAAGADIELAGAQRSFTLAPFSLTAWDGDRVWRIARAEREPRSGEPGGSRPHCSALADFTEKRFPAAHFENERYNQNRKIASGGTVVALASPGATAALEREADGLRLRCALPGPGQRYYQCGVKLPLVSDALADRKVGADWSEGTDKGVLRIAMESAAPVEVQLHLEGYDAAAVGFNSHHRAATVEGARTVEVPLRELRQDPAFGVPRALREVLRDAAALRIEVRQPSFNGELRIRRVEVCDSL